MAYEDGFAALGDPTRKAIFDRLRQGPHTVGALADGLPVSRPAISQHLKVLKDAGLVTDHAQGTRRLYRTDPSGLCGLRDYLNGVWEETMAAHRAEVARQLEERKYA
jgi:DNA-binding transcriptional ArsR family regulator